MKTIVNDAMGAVVWAKDHAAEYRGDPARIALGGHSAGAQLSELTAVACRDPYFAPSLKSEHGSDACVQAVIPASGYFEFEPEWGQWNEWLLGTTRSADPELYIKCAPMSYDLHGLPPHFVIFGENDMHRARGEAWARKLAEAGVTVETFMAPGAEHHWIMWH